MATIECWQPYTPLDQLLSSSLVLTDGQEEVEYVRKGLPRSTRRAIKFIRNQKLRPKPGFQRRETWLENQLALTTEGDTVYHDLVKTNNRTTLRNQSSQSPRPSTEQHKRWINLDLLLDPSIQESSKSLVRIQPSQTVVYRRKHLDTTVCSLKQPFEPIPVYDQQTHGVEKHTSRSSRHSSRTKRIVDSDRSKSLEDIDKSETPRDGSKVDSTGGVSKPENYTEILHYVDGTKSMGAIDTFEPIYVISRKTKVAKACGHRLPMVRVGGGWMEVPDYLRFHVPMHVHAESTKDGQDGNLIIRSQRPRSQLFSKKGECPSWTATLSRGTKGSASTTMRQRLI